MNHTTIFLAGCLAVFLSAVACGQDLNTPQESTRQQTSNEKTPPKRPKYASQSLVYKHVGDRKLKLHVTKPDGWNQSDTRPAIVFFHGGGWVGGAPGQFDEHSKYLSERGMVAIQVEYRLLPRPERKKRRGKAKPEESQSETTNKQDGDTTPTRCIQDAKSAMRWVRGHADELGIDANRIASGGGSAGGHLAAFLGTTDGTDDPNDDLRVSARANAMVLFNPVYDNGPDDGWGRARVADRYQEFSPAHNISKDDAPSIVFLGDSDNLIPVSVAERFKSKMESVGVKSELKVYQGQAHGFFNVKKDSGKWYRLTIAETERFLTELGWLEQQK